MDCIFHLSQEKISWLSINKIERFRTYGGPCMLSIVKHHFLLTFHRHSITSEDVPLKECFFCKMFFFCKKFLLNIFLLFSLKCFWSNLDHLECNFWHSRYSNNKNNGVSIQQQKLRQTFDITQYRVVFSFEKFRKAKNEHKSFLPMKLFMRLDCIMILKVYRRIFVMSQIR